MSETTESPKCFYNHSIGTAGGYCKECAKCTICQKPLTSVEYSFCLRSAAARSEEPVFEHPGCFKEIDRLSLASESVTLTKAVFDKLNAARLLLTVDLSFNVKSHEVEGDYQASRWIHEMNFEEQYLFLRKMESVCATVSLALSKHRKDVEAKLDARDQEKYADARKVREIQKVAAPKLAARIEKKVRTKEEKAAESYAKAIGCTIEEATTIIQEMKAKREAGGSTIQ